MSVKSFEAEMLAELREVAQNNKIRQKDIMEWRTTKCEPQAGEKYFFLPNIGVHVCVKLLEGKQ